MGVIFFDFFYLNFPLIWKMCDVLVLQEIRIAVVNRLLVPSEVVELLELLELLLGDLDVDRSRLVIVFKSVVKVRHFELI